MGTVYATLGAKVDVVELADGLLMGADRDLVKPLEKRLKSLLENIFLNTKVGSVYEKDGKVEVAFEGPGKFGTEAYDLVLVSVGRTPSTRDIGLENTMVEMIERGFVRVDSKMRSVDPSQ